MYNLDYFSYRKEPIVRIKQIGIYPLDDEGRAKYFSKDSFTHHYLRKTDPSVFNKIIMNTDNNEIEEEKVIKPIENKENLNTLSVQKAYEGLKTEPNQIDKLPNSYQNNTISSSNTANNRYTLNNMNKKKNYKLNNLRYKSYSISNKNKNLYTENKTYKKENDLNKTFKGNRKINQSFDNKARLTGLPIFKDRMARTNPKLPIIMGGFNHENNYIIKNIRTGSKEMGENYNPYNFICPHVNRTKRNYVGGLFHG